MPSMRGVRRTASAGTERLSSLSKLGKKGPVLDAGDDVVVVVVVAVRAGISK